MAKRKRAAAKPKVVDDTVVDMTVFQTMKTSVKLSDGVVVDAAILSMEIEKLEDKHDLAGNDWSPTPEFLTGLSDMLRDRYKVEYASPMMALSVYGEVGKILSAVKNVIGSRVS